MENKRYLRKFDTLSEYDEVIGQNLNPTLPNVSLVKEGNVVKYNPYVVREAYYHFEDGDVRKLFNSLTNLKAVYVNDSTDNLVESSTSNIITTEFLIDDSAVMYMDEETLCPTIHETFDGTSIESHIISCESGISDDDIIALSYAMGMYSGGAGMITLSPYATIGEFITEGYANRIDSNTIDLTLGSQAEISMQGVVVSYCAAIFTNPTDGSIPVLKPTYNKITGESYPQVTYQINNESDIETFNEIWEEKYNLSQKTICKFDSPISSTDIIKVTIPLWDDVVYEGSINDMPLELSMYYKQTDEYTMQMNGCVLMTLPPMVVFLFKNDTFVPVTVTITEIGEIDPSIYLPNTITDSNVKVVYVLENRFNGVNFNQCSNLTKLNPRALYYNTSIEENAFNGCSNLNTITIPNSVTSIGNYAFNGCSNLNTIAIPNSVTSIGINTFNGCLSLSSITISNSVTSIEDNAFNDCSSLSSITIPDSVTSIGNSAFYDCSSLTSITIPSGVTSIGNYVFNGCSSLNRIVVASNNTVYDSRENCNALIETATNALIQGCNTTVIPNSVTSIGNYAFDGCSSLSSITIPSGVTSIGNCTFQYCSSLSSITIPSGVTSIGYGAFDGCSSLSSITIPSGVTSIGMVTFQSCSSLSSITIPNSVTSIGYGAFQSCSSLSSVQLGNRLRTIEQAAFYGCSSLSSITIPNSVTTFKSYVFYGCSSLSSITIPSGVTSIEGSTFYGCSSLSSITIPNSIRKIGQSVFYGCSSLSSITIPSGVTSIGYGTFNDCSSLSEITCLATTAPTLESYSIFKNISSTGVLRVPSGSNYSTWLSQLGSGWTIEYMN